MGRNGVSEENKKEKLREHLKEIGKDTRFSSENQASGEAKSKGWVKKRKREELKVDMFNELFNKPLHSGADALEQGMILLKNAIFAQGDQTKMSYKERVRLFMEVADFLGIKESLNIYKSDDEITGIEFVVAKPKKKLDESKTEENDEKKESEENKEVSLNPSEDRDNG